jgi:2-dehydro-3-deoxyphosphogluconate aldolase/(4S)-4-hydroxy-2-oxoglutarate aldolase
VDVAEFEKLPLLGILRGIREEAVAPLTETMVSAGLRAVEITMNTEGAPHLIEKMVDCAKGRLEVGAGTVLDLQGAKAARGAGATFIVSPVLVGEVLGYCVQNKIPAFPGALTPLEIYQAHRAGAAMVKVFPAKFFGPEYFKEIRGPFRDIKLLACGGITPENLKSYFDCGASAVAFGASVFRPEWLAKKDFKSIGAEIRKFISAFQR